MDTFEKVKLTHAELLEVESAATLSPCMSCEWQNKQCVGTKACDEVRKWENRPKKAELRVELGVLYDAFVEMNILRNKRAGLEQQLNELQAEYNTVTARLTSKTAATATMYEIER